MAFERILEDGRCAEFGLDLQEPVVLGDALAAAGGAGLDLPAAERKKKSELVEPLDKLFADAAAGRIEDKALAKKLNAWLPANLREPAVATDADQEKAA